MSEFLVTSGNTDDIGEIIRLYREVAAIEGGLARTADEISDEYVTNFVSKAVESGIIVVAKNADGRVIGEIHGYALGPRVFAHILGELTIAVLPDFQGRGVGKIMFIEFMCRVEEKQEITRVELTARESNARAIGFYENLGFVIEGRMANRIRSAGGGFESDIPMAWLRS